MTPRHFCTYFDHNYLPRAMVMMESLHEHCPEAHIHVLCLSRECREALSRIAYPFVSLLDLAELETADPELAATRGTRTLIEYYFTITPCLPWYLLTGKGLAEVTYLDADMMFFSSPVALFEEAEGASVIITPHRFPESLKDREAYGKYNVSWLTFRNTPEGLACLEWYRSACLGWCHDRLESDRFADQKYLDFFQDRFSGVHVMRHPGGGVAPWNLSDAQVIFSEGSVSVNGSPLVFYHAHGVKRIRGPFFSSGLLHYNARLSRPLWAGVFLPYCGALVKKEREMRKMPFLWNADGVRGKSGTVSSDIVRNIYTEIKNRTLVFFM